MITIKVIYDNRSKFILDIVKNFQDKAYLELYNYDSKYKRKIKPMLEDFGTSNFPLLIFQDENLKDVSAIWSESDPDWDEEINNKLNLI